MSNKKSDPARRLVADNRKARFNYEILDTLEAGLVLTGTEVKSLRANQANIAESYASFEGGEFWLINSYIPEYTEASRFNHQPRRRRKLLVEQARDGAPGPVGGPRGHDRRAASPLFQ